MNAAPAVWLDSLGAKKSFYIGLVTKSFAGCPRMDNSSARNNVLRLHS
jgi:hypothetical protein